MIHKNVSRSYLQSDSNVRKISNHITKKVADKLAGMFKKDRTDFEKKWDDIKIVIEYGMLSEEKFFEKADAFALYPTVDGKYFTFEELTNAIKTSCEEQQKGITTFIEVILNQELGEPFRRDAMKKPVEVAGISSSDMQN